MPHVEMNIAAEEDCESSFGRIRRQLMAVAAAATGRRIWTRPPRGRRSCGGETVDAALEDSQRRHLEVRRFHSRRSALIRGDEDGAGDAAAADAGRRTICRRSTTTRSPTESRW